MGFDMVSLADYDAWKSKQDQANVGAANVVLSATDVKPDEAAGDMRLASDFASATGNPVPPMPMVREYRNVFQAEIERQKATTILSNAPRLTEWLRNPDNAAIARDDLENMSWLEGFGRGTLATGQRAGQRLQQMGNQFMFEQTAGRAADRTKSFGELVAEHRRTGLTDMQGNPLEKWDGTEYLFAFGRWVDARYAEMIGTDDAKAAQEYGAAIKQNIDNIRAIPKSHTAQEFEKKAMVDSDKESLGAALRNFASATLSNPLGAITWSLETAGESAPQLMAALGTTILTRNPVAGATVGGVGSYATERYTSPAEFFKEKGIDLGKPEDVKRAIGDPQIMQDAANRGVIRGLVIGGFDLVSMGVAGRSLAGNPLVEAAAQAASQALLGAGGEYAARVAAGQEIDWNEVIAEGLGEMATGPIDAGIAGRRFIRERKEAQDAEGRRSFFEALSGQSQASAVRERMPDKFRQFVEEATKDGPVADVYVPADQFVTYFQGAGLDPFALVDTLEGVTRDDLDAALAGGGDLKIPTATYAEKIAGSEHDAFLMENMRFDPNHMTAREAADFNAKVDDIRQAAWEEAENARLDAEQYRQIEDQVYDRIVSELRRAGRSTEVATTEALPFQAFYRTMAQRSGLTPEEFVAQYMPPRVEGSIPQGMQLRDTDALNRTLAEARARKAVKDKRVSLLEFISDYGGINDVGGELKYRNAETVSRGKGKRTLKLARKGVMAGVRDMLASGDGKRFGVDDVARAVVEAGYMAGDPAVIAYREAERTGAQTVDITRSLWEAIDSELRGEAQFSAQDEADPAIARAADLDQIEAYLNSIGVSLDDDDAAIRSAMQEAESRQYAQVTPEQARAIDMPVELPTDPLFAEAVANTPGAQITEDGLLIDLVRYQKDEQTGATSVRTGVFYLPAGTGKNPYKGGKYGYGGRVEVRGETLLKRPLFVKGATGGKAPEAAYDAIKGKGAYDKMRTDVLRAIQNKRTLDENGYNLLEEYGADGNMIWEIVPASKEGNQLAYALQENIVAHAVREAGYDSVVGYSVGRGGKGAFISEVFDVREIDYPTPGETATLHPQFGGRTYYQSGGVPQAEVDAFADTLKEELGLRSLHMFATKNGDLKLNMIAVPVDKLGGGIGSQAMQRIVGFADARGLRVTLTTGQRDDGFGTTSQSRLVKFYKRFGFVENKGRNKDFAISDNMYREPRPAGSHLFQRNESGPRGSIQFPAGNITTGQSIIRLMETANLSTFTHEAGHFYLEVLKDMAANDFGTTRQELDIVKGWWRENAADVAKDANRAGDAKVTAEDVIAALDNGTTGDAAKDAAVNTGMHEQWARGLEAYFMEGKAPSADLRAAFEKVRAWLLSIYRAISGLDVKISDELRGVFDRMLATDEQIEQAQESAGGNSPVFATAEQMGLTDEEFGRLMKLRYQAESDARGRLLKEAMGPIRREREKWFKDERAKVREQVEREVNASPMFRALEWMGNRRWLGEGKPEGMPDMRLSKDALVDIYGEGVLTTLRRGKQTVYAVDGGMHPDDAAGWFGFDSGDEMVKALEKAPNRVEAIDAETDKIMYERHGDVLNDGTVEEKALDAVHTDKRGQWIAAELKAIVDVAGSGTGLTIKEARATARSVVSGMRVRDALAANRFLAAERKAAREAAQLGATLAREGVWLQAAKRRLVGQARKAAAGDAAPDTVATAVDAYNARFETTQSTFTVPDQQRVSQSGKAFTIPGGERTTVSLGHNELVAKLIDAKRRQLLNHALYSEARSVGEEIGKAERFVQSLGKASKREKIAGAGRRENAQIDYLAAIDELLERYDFRQMSGAAEQRRGGLLAFVEAMKSAGRENELAIPDDVLLNAGRTPYKTIAVEELRGVVDSLKNLEHVALRWDKLIDAQQQRELDTVVTDIVAAFDANVGKRPPGRVRTSGEGARNSVRQFLDLVLNAGTILREIDGFKDLGAAYRNIKSPLDDAMNRLIVRKEKVATDLEGLYAVYSNEDRRRMAVREHIPELGYALSKWERIAVALNMGNEGNRQRLMDPRVRGSMTEAQANAVLATLDERDAKFVQSVWDYVGSFWPDIAARERRVTGTEPGRVEPSPVTIAGKELRGGYYPLKYDPRLSSLARDDAAQDIAQSLQAGRFGKAQTKNGHTKERAQSSGRDIELDMSVMHRHVNQVIYDLELGEAVANSWRVLQDGRIRSAFMDAGKQADFDALEIWLKDVAEGELRGADFVGRAARTLKSNFTAAKLAFNLSTVAVQVTGLSQTMVVVGKKDFARGLQAAFRPGVLADIAAKSPFMKSRQTTFNKDIYDFYSDPQTGPVASRWGDIKRDYVGPLAFWLMTKVQFHLVDVPTWLAGYQQGLRRFGNDEAKAIAHADAILKRSQASGLFHDRSAVERGSVSRTARQNDVVRLFTTLGSYMFAKFNVAYERSAKAANVVREEGVSTKSAAEVLSWTLDMAFLFTLEAVALAAIKGKLPNSDDDEDDTWLKFLAKETAQGVMGTVPFVRDVASTMGGFEGGGAYGAMTKEIAQPIKEMAQGEFDKGLVKSVINATGLATGLPATQINRAVDAEWRRREGDDVSPLEYLLGKAGKGK